MATTSPADPFAATTEAARLAAYTELAAQGPVVRSVMPNGVAAWVVTGYDEARAALNDPRFAKSGTAVTMLLAKLRPQLLPAVASHMLRVDGSDHRRLRTLVNAAFTRRPMEALDSRITEITQGLLDDLAGSTAPDEVVDLVTRFAYPLPMTVICDLLGVPEQHRYAFRELTATLGAGVYIAEESFAAAVDDLVPLLRRLVALKRDHPGEDLISALVAARDGADRLSEDELTSMVWLLVVAGHETTINLLASGVLALLTHPDQLARLRAEPELIGSAIEELLRFTSPVQATFPVIAAVDVELGGVTIPAGDVVAPVLLAANRDATRIAAPATLDIGRTPNHHVAFGHGAHHCLGAPLARLEARIALTALFDRFADLALAVPADQLTWRPNFLFHGLTELPVRLGKPTP